MLDVAVDARHRTDEAVRSMLISRAEAAHRLANWILHDPVAAEDAVQDAALLAWSRRRSLRGLDNFDAWFNRVLVNVCRGELRRRARKPLVAETEPMVEAMSRIADERGLKERLRSAGVTRAATFTWENTAKLTLPVLSSW